MMCKFADGGTRRQILLSWSSLVAAALFMSIIIFPLGTLALAVTANSQNSSPIRLQAPHPELSPSEQFQQLATICDEHGIDEWDVYGDFHKTSDENSFLRDYEAEMAKEFGKEDAVFMPSGVMAQSIALLIHYRNQQEQGKSNKKKMFACHPTSHLLLHEERGFQELCGFEAIATQSSTHETDRGLDAPPMLNEHLQNIQLDDVSTLILELPHRELGGKLTPWKDVLAMQQTLRSKGVAFHCDGARIFEATAGYPTLSLAELAEPFDSFYISFYKGLGGMSGAMLMGSSEFCAQARVWLRRFGGNLFTLLPYAVSAWAGYQSQWKLRKIGAANDDQEDALLSFSGKHQKLVRIVERLTRLPDGEAADFAKMARFEPEIPQVCMVHLYLRPSVEECTRIRDDIQEESGVCIFHRIRALAESGVAFQKGYRSMMELSIGPANGRIPDDVWVQAWSDFASRASTSQVHTEEQLTGGK